MATRRPVTVKLAVRRYENASACGEDAKETDSRNVFLRVDFSVSQSALVVLAEDLAHPATGWRERLRPHREAVLGPLLEAARSHGLMTLEGDGASALSPAHGFADASAVTTADAFEATLRGNGVDTLLYAGYASDGDVLLGPFGIAEAAIRGFRTILIRDCTKAFESPDSAGGEWWNFVAANTVEHQWGATTTFCELVAALEAFSAASPIAAERDELAAAIARLRGKAAGRSEAIKKCRVARKKLQRQVAALRKKESSASRDAEAMRAREHATAAELERTRETVARYRQVFGFFERAGLLGKANDK